MRPALSPIISGIGRLSIAARPRGHAAATIAAAASGAATNSPMSGNGCVTASHPADAAAAASPIHRPTSVARISLALREASIWMTTAATASVISAAVTMIPMKSSI
jgi:hypothetical protein